MLSLIPSSTSHRVLVIGGGYAGVVAAARVARERDTSVTLVDARDALVQRIRLHQLLAGASPATLPYAPALRARGVRFVQGYADELRLTAQTVTGRTPDGGRWSRGYDTLILAIGSRTAAPVPGVAEHALRLDDPRAVTLAADRLRALPSGARVVVVGAGATGLETAAELAERYGHLDVTLATASALGAGYAPGAAAHLRATLARLGVRLHEGFTAAAVEPRALLARDGTALPFDLCVWTSGFEAPALARDAGLTVHHAGRVAVDPFLRAVGHDNVFVAGDAAAVRHGDRLLRMGCATAMPIGAHAGENVRRALRREALEPFRFAFVVRCISLGRRDGLIQFTDDDDVPRARFLVHRRAALVKELVSRSTLWAARAESRLGLPVTVWRRPTADAHVVPDLAAAAVESRVARRGHAARRSA